MAYPIDRLKERPDFLRVASTRVNHVTPGLILQMREHTKEECQNSDVGAVRIGFTVSKKVGNAVVRNRVKRRLRAAVDLVLSDHAKPHRDFVIVGRQNAFKRSFTDLKADLKSALKKLSAYKDAA